MVRNAVATVSALALIAGVCVAPGALAQEEHAAPHWAYQGETGPAEWGELEEAYAACAVGLAQSPIDIPGDAALSTTILEFAYDDTALNVLNNGHTLQVNYDSGSTLTVDGKVYSVAQFHFHVPSEHTIEGVAAPLEMHIVHVADDGALAVVGVLFDFGEEDNAFLAAFWDGLPAEEGEAELEGTVNVAEAFDAVGGAYSYSGSLTTPPCSEGVAWFVMEEHQEVSRGQVAAFVERIGINARPTQPLNDREIGG